MKPQTQLVLRHLEKYGSITPKEAYENYRIMRLAARIKELRREFNIVTTYESHGRGVHAKYVYETERHPARHHNHRAPFAALGVSRAFSG